MVFIACSANADIQGSPFVSALLCSSELQCPSSFANIGHITRAAWNPIYYSFRHGARFISPSPTVNRGEEDLGTRLPLSVLENVKNCGGKPEQADAGICH